MTNEKPMHESTREERHARADARKEREESRPKLLSISAGRRKALRSIRVGLVIFALASLYYINTNFEFLRLPEDRCTQISAFEPGVTLLVYTSPKTEDLVFGDVVLFTLDSDAVTYGRLGTPPGAKEGELVSAGGYWILGDNPECPMDDSISLGAIPADRIVGRVLFPMRF